MFNLGQDRIVLATVKQGLNRDQIFHQIRDGRQRRLEFWRPEGTPRLEVLSHQHPTAVNPWSIEGPVRVRHLALVGWNEMSARLQIISCIVEINPKHRLLRRSRQGRLGQGWLQRPSTFDEVNPSTCVGPSMSNGTCRATASAHTKDGPTVRTTTGQTCHSEHAGPVRARGANILPLNPEGVHAQQGVGIVNAVPSSNAMLERRGEAQPTSTLGKKGRASNSVWPRALCNMRLHDVVHIVHSKVCLLQPLEHAFHAGRFDAQGP